MKIIGMEVTQGIQYFQSHRHLIDNFGPDNSLRLVALKPAWVRIYLRSESDSSLPDVTGTGTLRKQMTEAMKLRRFSPRTQQSYLKAVTALANYYRTPPDQLDFERTFARLY